VDNLRGISSSNWLRLLRENRFAIDRAYRNRAWALTMISLRNSRIKRREDARYAAEAARAVIQPPIFILGHWRSGTTLMHELLALDEQFAYPNQLQVANPHTFLTLEHEVEAELAAMEERTRPMDNMLVNYKSPGEDEAALSVMSLCSPVIAWAFPRQEARYDRYHTFTEVPEADLARWSAAFVSFLKKLTLRYQKPLVLKSPPHTARVRLLLRLFPDARFIHIYRDPYTVFRSTQQLYAKAVPFSQLQEADPAQLDAGILHRYALMYDSYFADKAQIPAGRLHEVRFEDLEQDMVGQLERTYAALGLPDFARVRPRVVAYQASKAGYQKNRHQPLAEPQRAAVAQAWGQSFDQWGYSR
jgi:omega-hydroxy-beta-dihydromenaquinone-9 sulfotransferase